MKKSYDAILVEKENIKGLKFPEENIYSSSRELREIDIKLRIAAPPASMLLKPQVQEGSASILQRVVAARARQYQRFGKLNSMLAADEINSCIKSNDSLQQSLAGWADSNNVSLRSINKIIKVARTIADLEQSEHVEPDHLLEAFGYYS